MRSGLLRRQLDRQVRGALADPRRAAHGPRAVALERRPLVGEDGGDPQVLAHELVVVLGVGDRRLQQLAPGLRRGARREGEDRAGLGDVLAADVVAHQPRLAGGGAHVLGLRADAHARPGGTALVAPASRGRGRARRRGRGASGGLVGGGRNGRLLLVIDRGRLRVGGRRRSDGLGRVLRGVLGLVGGHLGLACLARPPGGGLIGGGLGRVGGALGRGGRLVGGGLAVDRRVDVAGGLARGARVGDVLGFSRGVDRVLGGGRRAGGLLLGALDLVSLVGAA